eukprot:2698746-Amphidinium_carterae.3
MRRLLPVLKLERLGSEVQMLRLARSRISGLWLEGACFSSSRHGMPLDWCRSGWHFVCWAEGARRSETVLLGCVRCAVDGPAHYEHWLQRGLATSQK